MPRLWVSCLLPLGRAVGIWSSVRGFAHHVLEEEKRCWHPFPRKSLYCPGGSFSENWQLRVMYLWRFPDLPTSMPRTAHTRWFCLRCTVTTKRHFREDFPSLAGLNFSFLTPSPIIDVVFQRISVHIRGNSVAFSLLPQMGLWYTFCTVICLLSFNNVLMSQFFDLCSLL